MKYRKELDGLRAVALLPVMFFHAGYTQVSGGYVGVDVFFVISGYLITSIILAEKTAGTFSLVGFYERRVRRILPALFFVILACLPFAWLWLLPDELKDFSKSLVRVLLFLSNVYFSKDTGYFAVAAEEKPLLHTWSLAVEEQYYLFFPLLILMLWRFGRKRLLTVLALLALVSLIYAEFQSGINPEKLFFSTLGRIWELLIGSFLAFYFASKTNMEFPDSLRQAGSSLGLALILFAVFYLDKITPFPSMYALLPTIGAALIILFATPQTLVGKLLATRLLVGIGLVSYSAYLWHQPLLAFVRLNSLSAPNDLLLLSLIGGTFVLATLTWRYIEQPFRNKDKFNRKSIFWLSALAGSLLMTAGVTGEINKGFPGRYSDRFSKTQMERNQLAKERFQQIRAGECQFNTRGLHQDLDEFIKHWDCERDPDFPNLLKVPYIVVGDSHSADIVVAFKQNGYLPLQMGGAGCSLVPRLMPNYCVRLFDRLKQAVSAKPDYTHIILVNHLSRKELSEAAIKEMVSYWSSFGKRLIFFTAMPEYTNYKRLLFSGADGKPEFRTAMLPERPEVTDYLALNNVSIINTRRIFCSLADHCGYRDAEGHLLLTDGHHLSKRGAQLFGMKLIESGQLPNFIGAKAGSPSLIR